MNLKYYLRGLGIGILMTAVVLIVSASEKSKTLSDAEVIERAKALGMTESGKVLSQLNENMEVLPDETEPAEEMTENPTEVPTVEPNVTPEATVVPTATPLATTVPTTVPTASPTVIPTSTPEIPKEPSTAGMGLPAEDIKEAAITINSGDGSFTVCRKLEEAGLISSASEYDTYLCKNGYDKRIRIGSYNIPAGSDHETIAKIISGK